jgi:hypothetical protein
LLEAIKFYNDGVFLLGVVIGVVEKLFFQPIFNIFAFLITYKLNNVEFVIFWYFFHVMKGKKIDNDTYSKQLG